MTVPIRQALETLYGLERRKSKLGLEGTRLLLEALGRPQDRFAAVHVAGTNGKGSVSALIERVLRAAGVRTGLFTSPHLVDFRERIRCSGRWADESRLERRLEALQGLSEARDRTFFEVATALGFDAFAAAGVEWAVVEVGLGGRLDTTNVLDPELAVVTRIALDHTEVLGDTLEAVATEKAGIVKPGVPVVVGAQEPDAAAVLARIAAERGAPHRSALDAVRLEAVRLGAEGARFRAVAAPWGALELEIRLRGRHQVENAATALAALGTLAQGALELPAAAVREGLAHARWPGRLEPCPAEPRLWWDAAHNPDGIARLARSWREDLGFEPPEALVLAVSADKDAVAMLSVLRDLAPEALLVVTRSENERALPAESLAERARAEGWRPEPVPGIEAALERALGATRGRVLLAGSLFAVGEAMRARGGEPGEWT